MKCPNILEIIKNNKLLIAWKKKRDALNVYYRDITVNLIIKHYYIVEY